MSEHIFNNHFHTICDFITDLGEVVLGQILFALVILTIVIITKCYKANKNSIIYLLKKKFMWSSIFRS